MPASGIQNIGLTALLAYQRALQVTAHNIANAGTPGYSRQIADFSSLQGGLTPAGPLGAGVQLANIRRGFNQLLFNQLTQTSSALGQNKLLAELTGLVDEFLGTGGFDLSQPLNALSGSLDGLSTDPTSIAARTEVLANARALADRFSVLDQRLQDVRVDTNSRVKSYTEEINGLVDQVADLNQRIGQFGSSQGAPNDLLDQRDQAVRRLSELMDISVVRADGNSYNISIANGQTLVVGAQSSHLSVVPSPYDQTELVVALETGSGPQVIDQLLTGGELSGALAFLRDVLTPAQDEIGLLAMSFANTINEQHIRGLDLNGNLGRELFTIAAPQLLPSTGNSNLLTDTTAISIDDYSMLSGDEYLLSFDGAAWRLVNTETGLDVPMTASGTDLLADGLRISPDPGAAAGDSYLLRPTRGGARGLELAIDDPSLLAAAAALTGAASAGNSGSGALSAIQVLDPTDPGLLGAATISFISPTSYQINGGPPQAYTPGADISFNGWQLQISGSPAAGDSFTVGSNQGAPGNGDNARLMGMADRLAALEGGTISVADAHRRLISSVGSQSRSLQAARDIEQGLLADIGGRLEQVQGVNLDEEAINLQQYQQAYSAAAEVFAVAEEMFQTLINSVRR